VSKKLDQILDSLDDQLSIKMEPELRHVLAHFYYAIECLIHKQKAGAMDNIKCIEGLIMFDGNDPSDWEKYYYAKLAKERNENGKETES